MLGWWTVRRSASARALPVHSRGPIELARVRVKAAMLPILLLRVIRMQDQLALKPVYPHVRLPTRLSPFDRSPGKAELTSTMHW